MKIGIASPVLLKSLDKFLDLSSEEKKLGMGATAVNNIIIGLLEEGHEVSVYSLDFNINTPKIFKGNNLKVYLGNYRKSGYLRGITLFNKEINQIVDFIKSDKPDIVNAHWTYEYGKAVILSKTPHLITFRDDSKEILKHFKDFYRMSRYLLDIWVRKNGSNFSVNSIYLQKSLKFFNKNLPVIPNPVNDNLIVSSPKKFPEHTIKIISILNGVQRKNPYTALKAFGKIRQKYKNKVEYFLIGNGYGKDGKIYQWAASNDLTEGVHFMGILQYNDLMNRLDYFDILLHPSLEESFGNTLLEGMAKGLPVIGGKDAGAVPWVLNYGENGILIDVTTEKEIEKALEELINSPEYYEELSRKGLDYIQNFIPTKIASQYYTLYEKIITQI